ncbi:partner and localizer of BRCA2 isoform X2 [Rhinatrema bivittatum]|uniref:partner and localizer of BRCA2 isoform X2 n=1 Tax=Rhinatrema bivittatum TaxID=194408 RepID=UPI0011264DA1|nr:partner and localizer of BRCA2 isoform X2 [Rhinatrema bivittatum]
MEETTGRPLTCEEREKLKQKLAFLKQEYNKTFNRLQRSQRAERVKTHVKKKIAEQNCLLKQEQSGMGIPDSRDTLAPSVGKLGTTHVSKVNLNVERRMTVSFNLQPEFFNIGGKQHESSVPEDKCDQKMLVTPTGSECAQEKEPEKSQRSRQKLRKNILKLRERESTCESSSSSTSVTSDLLCKTEVEGRELDREERKSPVFKRNDRILSLETKRSKSLSFIGSDSRNNFIPEDPASKECLSEAAGEYNPGKVTEFSSCMSHTGNNLSLLNSKSPTHNSRELEQTPSLLIDIALPTCRSTEETGDVFVCKTTKMVLKGSDSEGQKGAVGALPDLAVLDRSLRTQSVIIPCATEDISSTGSKPGTGESLHISGTEEIWKQKEDKIQVKPSVVGNASSTAAESALSSCTMVEGLLFPVEYYIRTTRRMSNCQKKVDLEAVIYSQLGKSRKGPRKKYKDITKSNKGSLEAAQRESKIQQGNSLGLYFLKQADSSTAENTIPATSGNSVADNLHSSSSPLTCHRIKSTRTRKGKRKSKCKMRSDTAQAFTSMNSKGYCSQVDCRQESKTITSVKQERPLGLATGGPEQRKEAAHFMPCGNPVVSEALQREEQTHNLLKQHNVLNLLKEAMSSDGEETKLQVHKTSVPTISSAGVQTVAWYAQQQFTTQQLITKEFFSEDSSNSYPQCRRERPLQDKTDSHEKVICNFSDGSGPSAGGVGISNSPFHVHKEMFQSLDITDFHLPDDEFGFLKLEKLKSPLLAHVEPYVLVPLRDEHLAPGSRKLLNAKSRIQEDGVLAPPGNSLPQTSNVGNQEPLRKKEFPPSALLSTPACTISLHGAGSQLAIDTHVPAFPFLGLTPAAPVLDPSRQDPTCFKCCREISTDTSQGEGHGCTLLADTSQLQNCVSDVLSSDGGEDAIHVLQARRAHESKMYSQEGKLLASQILMCRNELQCDDSKECCTGDPRETLSGFCAVDISSVWWDTADSSGKELCIVTACEFSISLWKPEEPSNWKLAHMWSFSKMPVIQIVPLPGTHCCVCVALGSLAIEELWLLFSRPGENRLQEQLVKCGYIYNVLGLSQRRLVSSSRGAQQQTLEIISLSEAGRITERQNLMPPEESILAFSEVEGEHSALVGTTVASNIVIWNMLTGQLLKMISLGKSYQASVCHKTYSDSGLLFIVLSHPYASDSQSSNGVVFTLIATNPMQAASIPVMSYLLPERCTGRYLEGDVQQRLAAAVLTSGNIAIWDLSLGLCTALLPPICDGVWAVVRWLYADSCLLAGQKDGSVYVYKYLGTLQGKAL